LRSARVGAKAALTCLFEDSRMVALGVIALFIIAFAALNLYEFGRID
jgi:hypothetical protein